MTGARIVCLGGGHGLAASLRAARLVTDHLTAVVTVADDGGSSGRLRREFDVLPPGDLRMALAALCGEHDWGHTWRDVLQHRYAGSGPLGGHALGNLLIVAIWDLLDDPVDGLDLVGRLLGAQGRVLPMAAEPLEILAEIRGHEPGHPLDVSTVHGQHNVASSPGIVQSIGIVPTCPAPCPEAVQAIRDADWVFVGPGSWFTSIMPHLLVPDIHDALLDTSARVLLNLNLDADREAEGLPTHRLLETLRDHAPQLRLDVIVADPASVAADSVLAPRVAALGARLHVADVALAGARGVHDPLRLAAVYRDIVAGGATSAERS